MPALRENGAPTMATAYASMPTAWSNKKKTERLRRDAYESLTRMLNRAVADTGVNFSIWSALRTHADQVKLFKENYTRVSRGRKYSTDRGYAGSIWARKPGGVSVASPDLGSNHQDGLAVDIHPAAIQAWIQKNGLLYGWSWDEGRRVGEAWHFRYIPSRDQMKHEGPLDHAAVQKVVGAEVDGKIGTGTIALIKAWQKKHGLTADGKVGAKTKQKMGLAGKGDAAPAPSAPAGGTSAPKPDTTQNVTAPAITIEVPGDSPNANQERFGQDVKTITFHWWGEPEGQTHDGTVDYLLKDRGSNGTSAHYVVSEGRVSRCVPEEWTAWANGKRDVNRSDISVECDPNNVVGTLPTAAALLADIWTRYPDAEVHVHSDWVPTECNGDYRDLMPELIAMAKGQTVELPTTPESAPAAALPTGKALLMQLIEADDYPLLRTLEHLCYYGDDSKREAVSGKMPNTLVPGEIFGSGKASGAHGLKKWQAQMVKRGYSLTVDGRYGPATEKAAKNLQRLAGIAQDGKIGPDTFYAAWLLPVVGKDA